MLKALTDIVRFISRLPDKILIGLLAFGMGVPMTYNVYAMMIGKTATQHIVCRGEVLYELSNIDPYASAQGSPIKQSGENFIDCLSEIDPKKSSLRVMRDVHRSLNKK